MYGIGLPDDILKKLYYKNALKIIPGLDPKIFPKWVKCLSRWAGRSVP